MCSDLIIFRWHFHIIERNNLKYSVSLLRLHWRHSTGPLKVWVLQGTWPLKAHEPQDEGPVVTLPVPRGSERTGAARGARRSARLWTCFASCNTIAIDCLLVPWGAARWYREERVSRSPAAAAATPSRQAGPGTPHAAPVIAALCLGPSVGTSITPSGGSGMLVTAGILSLCSRCASRDK